ncbi:hypothetical protein [Burkholderia oklahomensis]|uniref:hypothetical protein n=1 Tax=Burkholderia oklahomensis TaxID=342113 RepID=UPI0004731A1B|nr:hypothetical protein [Burkholderia oklahomensis]AJX34555.1 hypothetical protein BG90_5009 [Burkholderia oklahomensis C6786]AOI48699.1 hypothetical protein WI23_22965 [Burkholderia oklahomensis C6786]KUY47485.1 hypothetical protein WI23_29915 [Burkholderia oklahomensis C6786]MBI0363113.1 hypothetical protein [Burkholderia oklahomensis]SUY27217.1 Uncharacterised protein [Burkholderia oklahomensis]
MNVPMSRAALAAILLAACTNAGAQPLSGSPSSATPAPRTSPPQTRPQTPSQTPPSDTAQSRSPSSRSLASQTLSKHASPDAKPQYTAPLQRNFAFAQDQGRQEECGELASKIDNLARQAEAAVRSAPPTLLAPSTINNPTPWKVPAPPVHEPSPSRPLPSANGHAPSSFAPRPSDYGSRPWSHKPYPSTEKEAKEQRERSEKQIELETRYRRLHCQP